MITSLKVNYKCQSGGMYNHVGFYMMWYVDALFAVHPNMQGHTGGSLTMGRGFPISTSTKQRLNTRSSTESELVGVDDMMPIIIWTRHFLLSQGYGIIENLLLQDNRSSILLERNGWLTRCFSSTSISHNPRSRQRTRGGGAPRG